ncbi:MAG TPA: endopeptidase La [Candidatus Scatomorpha merdigallinarum]|nr:endopeptidase La [Candidatus Scatomorpha merdigallinarum]
MSDYEFRAQRSMPVLPLRGLSVFPGMLLNFDVERPMSVAALNIAMGEDQILFLTAQKDMTKDIPFLDDIYAIGTVCRVRQMLRQPGGKTVRVMVEGIGRGRIISLITDSPCLYTEVEPLNDVEEKSTVKIEALCRRCVTLFSQYTEASGNSPAESLISVAASDDAAYIADFVAQNVYLKPEEKQQLLEELRPSRRLARLCSLVSRELTLLGIERDISESTQEQMNRNQREYYLREQLKVIQSELGDDDTPQELDDYRRRIRELRLDEDVEKKLLKEVSKLSRQPFGSAEASVIRGYLDTCLEVPWNKRTKETLDVAKARKLLDEDHYGLDKVKERIIEFLSVRKLAPDIRGTVLCLVGPPGTGKTSIAMSIARAMNRKLSHVALGGVHDEAEIRGHRKTYIGSMPGRLVNGLIQAGSMNPVMVLDEIDKLGSDYRGDPSSALLEALDGEQNNKFRDNYMEIPIDLSDVLFITTANTLDTIPRPLLDRMEVIELTSYTDEEKLMIAKQHLLPKQRKRHGLNGTTLRVSDDAIREIISLYTRESGVRLLERELAALCRKCAAGIAKGEYKSLSVRAGRLEPLLGAPKYKPDSIYPRDEVGLVRGLAWTSVGGEVLDVEVGVVDGTGQLILTGNLGSVMQESCKAAITYIRSRAGKLGIDPEFYRKRDIHIHFPEGAVPKDGPSAGITICIGVISALTGIPVRRDLAMTGEITLRGRILPIGGLKEKTMAALRAGVSTVIIPAANEADLDEIDQTVRRSLKFVTADHVDAILDVALNRLDAEPASGVSPVPPQPPAEGARIGQ